MSNPIEIPSLEEIEAMDRKRSQAIEALEISDHSVKCQKCGVAVPIVGKLTMTGSNSRIYSLQLRVKWLENHKYVSDPAVIKQAKQELDELLKEEAKYDLLRTLPLHLCKYRKGYKLLCGKCTDKVIR